MLEEYIGKYDFCHSDCHVLLHFWNKLGKQNNFGVSIVQKILILNKKINIQILLATA